MFDKEKQMQEKVNSCQEANLCHLNFILPLREKSSVTEFSDPYFFVFGLNTEIHRLKLRIQSEFGEIRGGKTPYLETFHAVSPFYLFVWSSYPRQGLKKWISSCLVVVWIWTYLVHSISTFISLQHIISRINLPILKLFLLTWKKRTIVLKT